MITVTNYSHAKSENLSQISTASTLVFDTNTYMLTSTLQTAPSLVPTLTPLNPFVTFPDKTFSYMSPSLPISINVEAPCSSTASSFSYSFTPALPSWLTYSPTGSTSTQTFNVIGNPLVTTSMVTYSGQLSNAVLYNSTTLT